MAHSVVAGDPSLRRKNGYAQDDAIYERGSHHHFKLSHYPKQEPLLQPASKVIGYPILSKWGVLSVERRILLHCLMAGSRSSFHPRQYSNDFWFAYRRYGSRLH